MTPPEWRALFLGHRIQRIRRLQYFVGASRRFDAGPVELTMSNGRSLILTPGPDGETLAVRAGPYVDPWAEPTPENVAYVDRYGHDVAVDLSTAPEYSGVIDVQVSDVTVELGPRNNVVGVRLALNGEQLRVAIASDEVLLERNAS